MTLTENPETRKRGALLNAATWTYTAVVLAALVLIRWVGIAWWGVAVLLFMPRWLFLLPLLGLAVASGLRRCYGQWLVQGAIGLVVAGPLMGVSLPLAQVVKARPEGERVRVGTANLGLETSVSVAALTRWVEREELDVVCFQEGDRNSHDFAAFLADRWHVNRRKTIASRFPIVEELSSLPEHSDTGKRYPALVDRVRVSTPGGASFVVASVHLPTLRPGFHSLLDGDVGGLELHVAWWRQEAKRALTLLDESRAFPLVVAGDFNMPADDSAMAALASAFRFAFEEAGWGYGYTRPASYPWMRIDHILASPEWAVIRAETGPDIGSDHRPMSAELILAVPRTGPPRAVR
jgi:endonuclease/exonuclease/phosphatase family metal-dependent hydrolase